MGEVEERYLVAGELVTFTSGEYSDYSLHGTFVALETVTYAQIEAVAASVTAKAEKGREALGWVHVDVHVDFQAQLIREGWLVSVKNTERHIGSYGYLRL